MPARRKTLRRLAREEKSRKGFNLKRLFLFLGLVVFFFVFYFFFQKDSLWQSESRLSLAIQEEDGGVLLIIFDPVVRKITKIKLPGETQVEAARQLGEWRLKSLWQLGEQEGIGGTLVAETITKSFKMPTEAWAQKEAAGFVSGIPEEVFTSLFSLYQTNLSLKDRFNLIFFAFSVKNTDKQEIDLINLGYLKEDKLKDGYLGYKITRDIPSQRVLSLFVDNRLSQSPISVAIIDASDSFGLAKEVGEIIEVLGGKVVTVEKLKEKDFDCLVRANRLNLGEKLSTIFSCDLETQTNSNFDLEFEFGTRFAKRF